MGRQRKYLVNSRAGKGKYLWRELVERAGGRSPPPSSSLGGREGLGATCKECGLVEMAGYMTTGEQQHFFLYTGNFAVLGFFCGVWIGIFLLWGSRSNGFDYYNFVGVILKVSVLAFVRQRWCVLICKHATCLVAVFELPLACARVHPLENEGQQQK